MLPLKRALAKLVNFHSRVFNLIQFASSPLMRDLFFSTEIKITPIEKNRPALLKWPSNKPEWMKLISTIYFNQSLQCETGSTAMNSERSLVEKAIEHERAETVHCEYAVFAYLHPYNSSNPTFFYIGISKRPCRLSCTWMKAYKDTADAIYHTKVINNKWCKGWARPGLGQAVFQEAVNAHFGEMMENELCMGRMDLGLVNSSEDAMQ